MLYVDNDQIRNTDDLKVLGAGLEAVTYTDKEYAIKIHHEKPDKIYLEEQDCEFLTSIKTQSILTPQRLLYNVNQKYIGYKTKLIKNCLPMIGILSQLDLDQEEDRIYNDLQVFNENNIKLADLNVNCLYNGNLYFVDPGSFMRVDNSEVAKTNLEEVNFGVHNSLMMAGNIVEYFDDDFCNIIEQDCALSDDFRDFIGRIYTDDYYNKASEYDNIFDYFRDIIYEYGSLEEYKRVLLEEACENYLYAGCEEVAELSRVLGR